MKADMMTKLSNAVVRLDQKLMIQLCEQSLKEGINPRDAIVNGLSKGMELVSDKFDANEYFVPELLRAARGMKAALETLKPHIEMDKANAAARILIGTVEGDIHDIGKNIVIMLLEAAGHEVIDLGVDVPNQVFLSKCEEIRPQVLGMSAMLTTTMPTMKEVISLLASNGVRDTTKIIIGGAPISQEFANKIGADAYGENGPDAIRKIATLIGRQT